MTQSEMRAMADRLTRRLLEERNDRGHWTGELASSALSTATAVAALAVAERRSDLVDGGLTWLERTQNGDGGWGDTVLSVSNVSTTALCWAAFAIAKRRCAAAERAREYMARCAGTLQDDGLAECIARRYGNDRTFSVPILTVLAIADLVPWRVVPQLPFELAACPQSWFRWLQLPVVSYALPALIAIGHVRYRRTRSWNPVRAAASAKTLDVLERIQPSTGGFLEAVPLTSFVSVSLRAAGYEESPVLERGLRFLEASVREDGSWPIDTNLATWVTTLSVNALRDRLQMRDGEQILEWLLTQQGKVVHPYTGAAPGGWAWTDLPGGVPDADDTAGALIALHHLAPQDPRCRQAAAAGVTWLLNLQNRDGGIPTFCRGWGKLPFDRSGPDLTAHALAAWALWKDDVPGQLKQRISGGTVRALAYLARTQRPDGAWVPLWFGNQYAANDENPVYGTARVLLGLALTAEASSMRERAFEWLQNAQNDDGGWGGERGVPSSIEETCVAVSALTTFDGQRGKQSVEKGIAWLLRATSGGEKIEASPIGFYFARLWYFERLYPLIFAVDAAGRAAATGHLR